MLKGEKEFTCSGEGGKKEGGGFYSSRVLGFAPSPEQIYFSYGNCFPLQNMTYSGASVQRR